MGYTCETVQSLVYSDEEIKSKIEALEKTQTSILEVSDKYEVNRLKVKIDGLKSKIDGLKSKITKMNIARTAFGPDPVYHSLHPNFKFPTDPLDMSIEAIIDFCINSIANFVSPPKETGEDEEFACEDVAEAIRKHLPDEIKKKLREVYSRELLKQKARKFDLGD